MATTVGERVDRVSGFASPDGAGGGARPPPRAGHRARGRDDRRRAAARPRDPRATPSRASIWCRSPSPRSRCACATTLAVSLLCLGLALYVIVIQDRWDGPTITVVCFSVLSGAALIALSYLFKQVDQLYETERSTTEHARVAGRAAADAAGGRGARLGPAALRPARPGDRAGQPAAGQRRVLRVPLRRRSSRSWRWPRPAGRRRAAGRSRRPGPASPIVRALAEHAPVAVASGEAGGALLAVPLLVRNEAYGVLALTLPRGARRSTTWTCAWPRRSAARSRWPSRTRASATRSARRRRPPSARGWRATCTTPSRSRCSPRASRPRRSAAAGGRPATRRATTSRTWSGSRAARSPRCARC